MTAASASLKNAYIIGQENFNLWSQGFNPSGYLKVLPHPDRKIPFKDPFQDWQADRPGNYFSSWGPDPDLEATLRMERLDYVFIDGFGVLRSGDGVIPWLNNEVTPYEFLQGYNGTVPGPMLITEPGDTLKIRLENGLDEGSNLHTHGLHVSALGHGDNVLISVPPGGSWNYNISIPDNHFIGPDWYHPHLHGTVNTQVNFGLGGPLILTTPYDLPDIDKFNPKTEPFYFMALNAFGVQQSDRPGNPNDPLNKNPNVALPAGTPIEQQGTDGTIPVYELSDAVFMGYNAKPLPYDPNLPLGNGGQPLFEYGGGPLAEPVENVIHTVNGQYNPTIETTTGAWNVFTFLNMTSNAFHVIQLLRDDGTTLTPETVQVVALDGDASGVVASNRREVTELPLLSPGQRVSFQYWFDEPGTYYLLSNGTPEILGEQAPTLVGKKGFNDGHLIWGPQVLATIEVTGQPVPQGEPPEPYATTVEQATEIDDLVNAARTGNFDRERTFVWSANLGGALLAPPDAPPNDTEVVTFEGAYRINGEYYATDFVSSMVPLTMPMLNTTEVWNMRNSSGLSDPNLPPGLNIPLVEWHPFHIHQNDFVVLSINGIPVGDLEGVYLDGVLSDTISLPPTFEAGSPTTENPYGTPVRDGQVSEIEVLMKFEDFPGSYVNHCHILFHEDAGMMAAVRVILNTEDTWLGQSSEYDTSGVVSLYGASDRDRALQLAPYGTDSRVPVDMAIGDVNYKVNDSDNKHVNDNVTDVATVETRAQDGHFTVRVFDGKTLFAREEAGATTIDGDLEKPTVLLAEFTPFEGLTLAPAAVASIAIGDINGDGLGEVIVGVSGGGMTPVIDIYSGSDYRLLNRLTPFAGDPLFRGSINLAAGDANGDNFDDLIVGQGNGGKGLVEVYSGQLLEGQKGATPQETAALTAMTALQPYGAGYTGEVEVASGFVLQRPEVPNGGAVQTYHANITTLAVDGAPAGQNAVKIFTYTTDAHLGGHMGGHGATEHGDHAAHEGHDHGTPTAAANDEREGHDGHSGHHGEIVPLPPEVRLDAEFTPNVPWQALNGSFADLPDLPRGEPILFGLGLAGKLEITYLAALNVPQVFDV